MDLSGTVKFLKMMGVEKCIIVALILIMGAMAVSKLYADQQYTDKDYGKTMAVQFDLAVNKVESDVKVLTKTVGNLERNLLIQDIRAAHTEWCEARGKKHKDYQWGILTAFQMTYKDLTGNGVYAVGQCWEE